MKVLFVYTRTEDTLEVSGEAKKILMQIDAMKKNGVDAELLYHNRVSKFNKILIRIPFYPIYGREFRERIDQKLRSEHYDAVYIRRYVVDGSFLRLLKYLREKHPNTKLLFEIPTYPYDLEWSSLIDQPLLIKERMWRKQLHKYVDRIVTFTEDDAIFGMQTIRTSNGIDLNKINVRRPEKTEGGTIDLLGVACVERWHGYDRLIQGLHDYYQDKTGEKRSVVFHIVGDGFEIPALKRLTKELSMEKHVLFHGSLHGQALDERFNACAIGVGSLGMRRIGLTSGYTLKLREYTARGIPFLYAYDDALIEKTLRDFYIKYPNDETPIDVERLVRFFDDMQSVGFDAIAAHMRAAAAEHLTWRTQMQPIAGYLNENG